MVKRIKDKRTTIIRHWFPILTICPENNLPDLIYVSVVYENEFAELYSVRKQIRKLASMKKMYMEDIAENLMNNLSPMPSGVHVRLAFNRHVVLLGRDKLWNK